MLRDISDSASLLKFFYIQSAPPETKTVITVLKPMIYNHLRRTA